MTPRVALDGRVGPVRHGGYLPLSSFLVCLTLAGCAAAPAAKPDEVAIIEPPPMPLPPRPPPQAVVAEQRRVTTKSYRAVAEAKRYVAWKQAKAPIVNRLTILTARARKAVADLQAARTTTAKIEALPAAEQAVTDLQHYLCCEKGD